MVRKKSGNFDRLSEHESLTISHVQLHASFYQNAISRGHGKFSEVREKESRK